MIHAAIATVTETVAVKWIALICSTKIDSSVFLAVYFHTILKLKVLISLYDMQIIDSYYWPFLTFLFFFFKQTMNLNVRSDQSLTLLSVF